MKKKILLVALTASLLIVLPACSNNGDSDGDDYNMEYALDAHQYSLFLARQIDAVTNQLSSAMILTTNFSADATENAEIIKSLEASVGIIDDAKREVDIMRPPAQYEENRENVLRLMELSRDHIQSCIDEVCKDTVDPSAVESLNTFMQNDFVALTAEFNVYYK